MVSLIAATAIVVASQLSMKAMIEVFYACAFGAGLAQLITGVMRWRAFGARAIILRGARSMPAAVVLFVYKMHLRKVATINDVAPCAAFGAFYFLVSAVSLIAANRRRVGRSVQPVIAATIAVVVICATSLCAPHGLFTSSFFHAVFWPLVFS